MIRWLRYLEKWLDVLVSNFRSIRLTVDPGLKIERLMDIEYKSIQSLFVGVHAK